MLAQEMALGAVYALGGYVVFRIFENESRRLGTLEAFSISVLPAAYKDAVSIAVLLVLLFVRPAGLFGSRELSRLKAF